MPIDSRPIDSSSELSSGHAELQNTASTSAVHPKPISAAPVSDKVFWALKTTFGSLFSSCMGRANQAGVKISHAEGERLEWMPPEILIKIFKSVEFDDLISLELMSRKIQRCSYTVLHDRPYMEQHLTERVSKYFAGATKSKPVKAAEDNSLKGEKQLRNAIMSSRHVSLPLWAMNAETGPSQEKLDKVLTMLEAGDHFRSLLLEACNMPESASKILSALAVVGANSLHLKEIILDLGVNLQDPRFGETRLQAPEYIGKVITQLRSLLESGISITSLGLNGLSIKDGMSTLSPALENNDKLRELLLAQNEIGPEAAQDLALALEKNRALTGLDLADNDFATPGALSLAIALEINSTLAWLSLSSNRIRDEGMAAIGAALQKNPHTRLQSLNLFGNMTGDRGLESFARLLEIKDTLTDLDVGTFFPSDSLSRNGVARLLDAVKHNAKLTLLGLTGLFDGETANGLWLAGAVSEMLAENKTLKKLYVDCNAMGEPALIKLIEDIPNDTGLEFLNIASNFGTIEPGPDLFDAIEKRKADIPGLRIYTKEPAGDEAG